MTVKTILDESFSDYKLPCMVIAFPVCSFKCGERVCQNSALALSDNIEIPVESVVQRYLANPITKAVVCAGLEPFDSFRDLIKFIYEFRKHSDDDIVIFTGYTEDELQWEINVLKLSSNIIVKFGRYVPDQDAHYDPVLGVNLASQNQYAKRITPKKGDIMSRFEKVSSYQYVISRSEELYTTVMNDYDNIKIPIRATTGSAGYDFFSPISFELRAGETIKIPTGIRAVLPKNTFLMIVPRSGLGFKYRLQLDNTVGIVDEDYANSDNEGHIYVKLTNDSRDGKTVEIEQGDAICQGIIVPYVTMDEEGEVTATRNGGFGSTGK